MSLFCSLW